MNENLFIKEYFFGILNYVSIVSSNAKKIFRPRLKKEHLTQLSYGAQPIEWR